MSIRPNSSIARSTMACTATGSAISPTCTTAFGPTVSISRTTALAPSRLLRALTTTEAPSSASASAIARPMFRPEPVTIATLPVSSPVILVPLSRRHARLYAGHPRLLSVQEQDVDGRDKPGHDGDYPRNVPRSILL